MRFAECAPLIKMQTSTFGINLPHTPFNHASHQLFIESILYLHTYKLHTWVYTYHKRALDTAAGVGNVRARLTSQVLVAPKYYSNINSIIWPYQLIFIPRQMNNEIGEYFLTRSFVYDYYYYYSHRSNRQKWKEKYISNFIICAPIRGQSYGAHSLQGQRSQRPRFYF